jgi:hypothetical protein
MRSSKGRLELEAAFCYVRPNPCASTRRSALDDQHNVRGRHGIGASHRALSAFPCKRTTDRKWGTKRTAMLPGKRYAPIFKALEQS